MCASLAQEYAKEHEPKMASKAPARSGGRERGLQKWQVSHVWGVAGEFSKYDANICVV